MEKYRDIGLKLTPQRLAILEYLDGNVEHPSAETIYAEIKKKYPTISFATIYKTLETLKERGNITELTIDSARRRYDPETGPHHHLICIKCKKIVDIFSDFPVSLSKEAEGAFEIVGNHIEFYGYCPECKKRRK